MSTFFCRLYERDPFTNKPIKSRLMPEGTELTVPNVTTTTLLMPGPTTTTYNHVHPHPTGCTSLIFPTQPMSQTVNFSTKYLMNMNSQSILFFSRLPYQLIIHHYYSSNRIPILRYSMVMHRPQACLLHQL